MQPSSYDIQREVEALRDIRRRSITPGALTIDPDLPNQASPTSPTNTYWSTSGTSSSSPSLIQDDSSSSSHSSSSERVSAGGSSGGTLNNPTDDPFHLFWVPASVHPEIAPAEFRAFLKEHARAVPPADGSGSIHNRSASVSSTSSGLSRKRSMLSRQYNPQESDEVEDEKIVPLRRNRSTALSPQLTIKDLQKLEELAEEASRSDDPSRLRNILRRSLSLNISPSALDKMDDMPEMGDEADAPIIVPPPGQILRRTARTKIRKPGLPGDGGGHRFGSGRRAVGRSQTAAPQLEGRTSSDISSSDHGDHGDHAEPQPELPQSRARPYSNEQQPKASRPDSFSEEALIYDAYARDDDEVANAPSMVVTSQDKIELPQHETPPSLLEALAPVLHLEEPPVVHHPQPQRLAPQPTVDTDHQQPPSRTPSPPPEASPTPSTENLSSAAALQPSPPSFLSTSPSPTQQRKEKNKRIFGKWGSDKSNRKNAKEKDKDREREGGFFGNLFSSKKKQEEQTQSLVGSTSGREAAQALLGQSKSSKTYAPSPSPHPQVLPGTGNMYARYPIHVERAIYRLSHIKLANPRRPLYEQVLISNLMFWYLGVINKVQSAATAGAAVGGSTGDNGATNEAPGDKEKADKEKEQRESEQREQEHAEKERLEREQREREQKERELEIKKKESKRGPLTKSVAGAPGGGRRAAEMPIRGPQYEMQHRVMEQEYGGYNGDRTGGMPMGRATSTPSGGGQYHRLPHQAPPRLVQPQPQQHSDLYYNMDDGMMKQYSQPPSRLPPGAMPPVQLTSSDQWLNQSLRKHSSPSPPPSMSPSPSGGPAPGPHRHSRSPPPSVQSQPSLASLDNISGADSQALGSGKTPARSLSATAVPSPSPPMNGKAHMRKGASIHAVPASSMPVSNNWRPRSSDGPAQYQSVNGMGEEEDLPLAVWQQQRRR